MVFSLWVRMRNATILLLQQKKKGSEVTYTANVSLPWDLNYRAAAVATEEEFIAQEGAGKAQRAKYAAPVIGTSYSKEKASPAGSFDRTISQEVVWSVAGAKSANTKIDEYGTLTIGLDETAKQLTVTAVSVVDRSKSDTAVVNVMPQKEDNRPETDDKKPGTDDKKPGADDKNPIADNSKPSAPKTGDNADMRFLILLGFVAMSGCVVLLTKKYKVTR